MYVPNTKGSPCSKHTVGPTEFLMRSGMRAMPVVPFDFIVRSHSPYMLQSRSFRTTRQLTCIMSERNFEHPGCPHIPPSPVRVFIEHRSAGQAHPMTGYNSNKPEFSHHQRILGEATPTLLPA